MRIVGYCRVSTEEQAREGVSLEVQEQKIRAYCQLYDFKLLEVVHDKGVSAKNLNRPGIKEILQMLTYPTVDGLIVQDLSRLTRSVSDWSKLIEGVLKNKSLISIKEQVDTSTPSGKMMLNMQYTFFQFERENTALKVSDALNHIINVENRHAGRVPYGFDIVDGILIKNEHFNTIIQLKQWDKEGYNSRWMVNKLESMGITSPLGIKKWQYRTIDRIIKRDYTKNKYLQSEEA